jgi:hypothetical protein
VKALADRFAEAFAEWLHLRARREWYAPDEQLANDDLIAERFRGIRPAFGYPACPDHSEKSKLFSLLGAERVGLALTESFAMTPAAAVSGIYLAHPQAKYFAVGRIGDDRSPTTRPGAGSRSTTRDGGSALASRRAEGWSNSQFVRRRLGYPGSGGRPSRAPQRLCGRH